jgi:hypothetical protein
MPRPTRIPPAVRLSLLLVVSLLGLALAVSRASAQAGPGRVEALRLAEPVRVDGVLDEAAWRRPSAHPLIQNEPDNGAPPRQPTDWWVAYDDEALYVAARLHESSPDSIRASLGRRDTWPESDWVFLYLDTYNDDRSGFYFSVNPSGVIGDGQLYNDSASDSSWDGVWDCATRIDGSGWSFEIRIPFSQLRFPDAPQQVWGINFSRRYLRCGGREELFHRPRQEAGFQSRFPDLVGIAGVHPVREIEALAYGTTRGRFEEVAPGDPFRSSREVDADAGLDLRYRLTNDLALSATVNPDFGQVEVDPAVVNLSDAETYYPEKRPFFVEDTGAFRFGREGTGSTWNFNWSDPTPLHSRRIGRAPQLAPAPHDHADLPGAATILGAVRLDGTLGGMKVGALSALTAAERARLSTDGVTSGQLVEPRTGYNALRLQRTYAGGRQGLGLMATGVLRDLGDPAAREQLAARAWSVGVDGWTRLDADGDWALRGYLLGSRLDGSAAALDLQQRSSRRYFQRPDAAYLDYDPARTSLSGWMGRAMLNKETGSVRLNASLGAISPGFEINDLGWLSRADRVNSHLAVGYRWTEPTRRFRGGSVSLAGYQSWDFGGRPEDSGLALFAGGTLANYWSLDAQIFGSPDRYSNSYTRGGPRMVVPATVIADFSVYSDERRSTTASLGGNYGEVADDSVYWGLWSEIALRPSHALQLSFSPSYSATHEATQWVTRVADPLMTATYGSRYVFAWLDMQQVSFTTRVDWTFSPDLTLQTYLQPLFATGRYQGLKEFQSPSTYDFAVYGRDGGSTLERADDGSYLVDPDGGGPAPAFAVADPDFNLKSMQVNFVLRWEYGPGSTFYLAWTQGRANFDDPGSMDLRRDMRSLMESPGDDIVMVKVTRRFGI